MDMRTDEEQRTDDELELYGRQSAVRDSGMGGGGWQGLSAWVVRWWAAGFKCMGMGYGIASGQKTSECLLPFDQCPSLV